MNIVIIEDESMTSEDMAEIIMGMKAGITIAAILSSVKEAISYFMESPKIDLIFSDIQLGDGLSLEIFKSVDIKAPIIFCTAYDEYALDAIKSNGIEYILKPFTKETIESAINKYNRLQKHFSPAATDYEKLIQEIAKTSDTISKQHRSILVYYRDKVLPVKIDDIALFHIDGEVNRLICFDGKSFIVNQSLDELEHVVQNKFFRVNRQYLLNRLAVRDASYYFSRKYVVNLTVAVKEAVIVGKSKSAAFLRWLAGSNPV
jgi:two-component system response regulator LytT